jgi:hypothetical protein
MANDTPIQLNTFEGIVKRIGGVKAVADVTNRSTNSVFNWRAKGFFPPHIYFLIDDELRRQGYTAARWLFQFDEPQPLRKRNVA